MQRTPNVVNSQKADSLKPGTNLIYDTLQSDSLDGLNREDLDNLIENIQK